PQFDILNFGNRAQRKTAVLNEDFAVLSEKQAQRDIYLQLNAAFHNLLSFDKQKSILEENLEISGRILGIVRDRFEEGVARSQEVNEAEVNVVTVENSLVQLEQNRRLQMELLKLLTRSEDDIRIKEEVVADVWLAAAGTLETDLAPEPGPDGGTGGGFQPGKINGRCCRPCLPSTGRTWTTGFFTGQEAALSILPISG
ncbi:MAG: TolC family protein, partial [Leadbetterella sp.]|nr:TolC family protein [Leadbetterella sp.]